MRKLDTEFVVADDDTVDGICEECGGAMTLVANEDDRCPFCETRYYTKRTVEIWRLEDGDDVEELEEGEGEETEE